MECGDVDQPRYHSSMMHRTLAPLSLNLFSPDTSILRSENSTPRLVLIQVSDLASANPSCLLQETACATPGELIGLHLSLASLDPLCTAQPPGAKSF